jgi:hypothetical protein
MTDFTPVTSVSYRETEKQRAHNAAGRTGNALHYVPDETTSDAGDYDNDVDNDSADDE